MLKVDIEKARNLIKELYMKHAIEGEGGEWVSYKKDEITKLFKENGFTEEEAKKLLEEHEDEVMLPYFKGGVELVLEPENPDSPEIPLYEMMDECDLADYYLETFSQKIGEMYEKDPRKYIMEGTFDIADRTERYIRTIYAKKKTEFLTKHALIGQLMDRGKYTSEEAEKIIKKYQERRMLPHDAEYIDVKQYRLKDRRSSTSELVEAFQQAVNYEGDETNVWLDEDILLYLLIDQDISEAGAKEIIEWNSKNLETRTILALREGYGIRRLEDLLTDWAAECETAQEMMEEGETGSTQATKNVQYKDIREIFKQAMEHGKKTLTYEEITEKIAEKCGVDQEEADTAFWVALSDFKIWPEWEKHKDKRWKDKEYWWGGSCDYFPPRPKEPQEEDEYEEYEDEEEYEEDAE